MRKAEVIQQFRDYMIRLMGLLVAPLIFSVAVCGIALMITNVTIDDIIGYGSVLLLDPVTENYEIDDFPIVLKNSNIYEQISILVKSYLNNDSIDYFEEKDSYSCSSI